MIIRDVISLILGNVPIVLFIVALITTVAKLRRGGARREVMSITYTLWGEVLFYAVGLGFVYVWYFHAFLADFTAPLIGWQPSPFEWELAWAELGIALVALLSLWRGYEMRLAATIAFATFSFGAAAQHVHLIITQHNLSTGNAGPILWFGDIALPVFLLLLAFGARDSYERTARRIGI